MELEKIRDVAVTAAQAGAERLAHYFRRDGLDVRHKARHDLVSEADEASESAILEIIRAAFPSHRIVSEEEGEIGDEHEYSWVVDPLDGTNNFVQGLPVFCISIAVLRDGLPVVGVVLDPQGDNLFEAIASGGATWNGRPMRVSEHSSLSGSFLATGYPFRTRAALDLYLRTFGAVLREVRAIRRCGAAALDLAYTAAGVYDGFFEFKLSMWDIAAGLLLVQEAGGRSSDLDGGGESLRSGNVVAGNPSIWRALLDLVRSEADEAAIERVTNDPVRV